MVQIIGFDIDSRLPQPPPILIPITSPPPKMPVATLPLSILLALLVSTGRGCIPTRTPEYIVDQEMWQELQKQATTSVLLTTVKETTDSSTSPSSAAPTTTTTTTTSTTSSTTTTTTTTFSCPTMPTPWSYNSANGHCYYVSTDDELLWQNAENNCNSYATDAHLASISDQEENDFITSIIGTGAWYWIGLRQPENENTFLTTGTWTDNTMYDYVNGYSNWNPTPAMRPYPVCATVRGSGSTMPGRWVQYACNTQTSVDRFFYVCEAPAI